MNLSRVFDQPGRDELLAAYRLASLRILDSLIHHALPAGDKSDYASFRENLSRVISKFEEGHAQPADILVCAGAASASIQEYHRHAVTALKGRSIELQAVVSLLTEAMAEVSAGSTRSVERLRHIEHRLSRSQELHDIRDLRQEMSACLADVREEAVSRQREAERIKASLQKAAPKSELTPQSRAAADASGIQAMLERATQSGKPLFVAILVIDRLHTLVARFGERAGAQIAAFFTHEARTMQNAIEVATWQGEACVALLDGAAGGAEDLELQLRHDSLRRWPMALEVGQRTVMVQISYSKWCLLPAAGQPAAQLLESMETFLAHTLVAASAH